MKIKPFLIVFALGIIVGSGATWFLNQDPQEIEEIINKTKLIASKVGDYASETTETIGGSVDEDQGFGNPIDINYPGNLLVLKNIGFTVGYCEERNNPAWVTYEVFHMDSIESGKRPSGFKTDRRTESKVSHKDYRGTGFDRGHMAPNYSIATRYGRDAQLETFYMSNIVPQTPNLNRGIWKKLEEKVSDYAQEFELVWVITGPIYDDEKVFISDGIEIPDAFYKIIVDKTPSGFRSLAFIFPQEVKKGKNLNAYLTTIDNIELNTGFDFLSELDDDIEDPLEAKKAKMIW